MMSTLNGVCNFNNNLSQHNLDKVKSPTYPRNIYLVSLLGTWPGLGSDEGYNRCGPTSGNLESGIRG